MRKNSTVLKLRSRSCPKLLLPSGCGQQRYSVGGGAFNESRAVAGSAVPFVGSARPLIVVRRSMAATISAETKPAASRCIPIALVAGFVSIVCLGRPHPRFSNAMAAGTRSFGFSSALTSAWIAASVCWRANASMPFARPAGLPRPGHAQDNCRHVESHLPAVDVFPGDWWTIPQHINALVTAEHCEDSQPTDETTDTDPLMR